MENQSEDGTLVPPTKAAQPVKKVARPIAKAVPQKINLVRPPKKFNQMTEEEMREYARLLGEAFKPKQPDPTQEEQS